MKNKTLILDHEQVEQKINRMAFQVYEHNADTKELIIAGISGKGFLLAEKIAAVLKKVSPINPVLIEVKLDKKNLSDQKVVLNMNEKELKNKTIILVDDVLNTGKTVIFGVKYFLDFPVKKLMTVVLIDRSHRIFPIKANFVGLRLSTTLHEHVTVEVEKKKYSVYLE